MSNLSHKSPNQIRQLIRAEKHTAQTSGLSMGHVQVNVVILPKQYANDFQNFFDQNSKPCPLLEKTDVNDFGAGKIGTGVDIRVDLPKYQVFKNGKLKESPTDIINYWNNDLVTFYIGCSFSFEDKLLEEGFSLRHIQEGKNVSMFNSNLSCTPVGLFHGNTVVSMRPFKKEEIENVSHITKQFPFAHGEPIHVGSPEEIGIKDLNKPDFGDAVNIKPNEIPVFWACGVTAIEAVKSAKLDLAITHAPGCMLVCDIKSNETQNIIK